MYLKSIEVHGFKSFANKLVFEFHDGITAIVGPNGSGKSNVADAVRWVLGEQSAKQLRGSKMEDIIFAGTELRKPLGYAYVALVINNEDHKLNIPYEEVKIARRVYRSGESEYLLNGAACRLKDIQEILLDTGIGKEGYSIIGQGQIDKILSGKPEERRELFDEAAGIVKFKKRKAASEKNLEEEQQNLTRIEDILSELKKQVGPLEEQSEKAKSYLAYRDMLKNLDIHMFLHEYDVLNGEMIKTRERQEIAANDLSETTKEFEKTKEEYVAMQTQLENCNRNLEEKKEDLSQKRLAFTESEGNIGILREQVQTVRLNKEHTAENLSSLKERIKAAKTEQDGYQKEKEDLDAEHEKLLKQQEVLNTRLEEVNGKVEGTELEISKCNEEILFFLNENTGVKTDEQRIATLLEQSNIKKVEITKKILENKTEAAGLSDILEREKKVLEDISGKISHIETAVEEYRKSIQYYLKRNETLELEHREVQNQYHMENSRLESLRNLTERYEGYGQSIKRIMEQKIHAPGIIGVVADIIRVKREYEIAVETALGGSIQNIVTDNEQTAKEMIAFLKKNRFGRATFLPLTNMKNRPVNLSENILSEQGVIGMASKLADADERYQGVVEYLLGRFVVVDTIDHAIVLAKKYHHTIRIVTTEGELLNPGGSMSGGAFKNNHNLLGRRREMEELEKGVSSSKAHLLEIREEIRSNKEKREDIQKKLSAHDKIRQNLELKANTAQLQYDRAMSDLEKNKEDMDLIRFEKAEVETEQRKLEEEIKQVNVRRESNEEKSALRKERIMKLEDELASLKEEQDALSQEHSAFALDISSKEQSVQFAQENLKRIRETIDSLEIEFKEAEQTGSEADLTVAEKEKEIEKAERDMEEIRRTIASLEAAVQVLTDERDKLSEKNKDFFEKREELSAKKTELDKECYRLNSQLEKQKEGLDAKADYMWEQYELTYHTAEDMKVPIDVPVSKLKEETVVLKNKIKALGDVNVNAIEQYKEIKERYEHLDAQHEDLIKAAEVLVGIIEDLDREMRKQFENQFGEIRFRFNQVFKELFGGGRGTLELQEEEDILEAGIRIIAQPPGKKLQNMMQMSGGEKALTAIALLFAIQSLKPSPFCLLDEIEAALDDSNVTRYAQYLHKLTKDTQFIVITHRRGTMNAADILYGITMQEKGVSTLVSVNLLDEAEIAN